MSNPAEVGPQPVGTRSAQVVSAGLLALLASIAVLLYAGFSLFLFALLLLALGGVASAVLAGQRGLLVGSFTLAFSLRVLAAVLVAFWLTAATGRPYIGGDDFAFDSSGRELATAWRSGEYGYQLEPRPDREADNAYNYVVAGAYVVSGWLGGEDDPLAAVLVNCLAGGLLVVVVYSIARHQFGAGAGRRAAMLAVFAPDLLVYSAVELRDVLLALLLAGFVLCLARAATRRGSLLRFGWMVIAGLLVVPSFRLELLPVMVLLLLANLGMAMLPSAEVAAGQRRRVRTVFLLAVFPGVLLLGSLLSTGIEFLLDPIRRYFAYYDNAAGAGSLGITLYRLPWLLRGPALLANLIALPFPPWTYAEPAVSDGWKCVYGLLNAETPFWYVVAPFSIIGGLWCFRSGRVKHFPVYGSTGLLLAAMAAGGAVDTRWRTMAMPLLLVLAAVGWEHRRQFPKIVPGWWVAMAAAVVFYVALKA